MNLWKHLKFKFMIIERYVENPKINLLIFFYFLVSDKHWQSQIRMRPSVLALRLPNNNILKPVNRSTVFFRFKNSKSILSKSTFSFSFNFQLTADQTLTLVFKLSVSSLWRKGQSYELIITFSWTTFREKFD